MNYYDKNMETLLTHHKYLEHIKGKKPDDFLEFQETSSGFITGKYKGAFVHSSHNPLKEAANLIYTKIDRELTSCIFYGFGLGYLVENFIDAHPNVKAVVIEPDPAFFLKSLESRDMRKILSSPNLLFFIDDNHENLLFILEHIPLSNIQIVKLRSVYTKDEDYYEKIDALISSYLSKKEVNVNTIKRFGKLWVRNLVKNISLLIDKPGISGLTGVFDGFPALVLASGPSLNDISPYLAELRDRFLLISVDTSLRVCLDKGIEPDFLIVVDPQYWNTRHIDWLYPEKALIVSESSTHPRIFRQLGLNGYFASSYFPLGQYFESIIGEKGKIGAGGSVATAAWDLARLLGAKDIYMGGLDLGFPMRQTHYKGAFFENSFLMSSNRLRPAESFAHKYLFNADPFSIESNDGNTTMTDKRMMIYKWWYEDRMKEYPEVITNNLALMGVKVDGMPYRDYRELLKFPVIRPGIEEKMHEIRKSFKNRHEHKKQKNILKESLSGLLMDLRKLKEIANEGLSEVLKVKEQFKRGKIPGSNLETLNKIDKKIVNSSSRRIVSFILQAIIQEIIHCSVQKKDPLRVLNNNLTIYEELKDSCTFHISLLEKAREGL
ncbi:MAG: motility associated factor glycosyltransferase family protein [Spirochaetales bacterium]|nr:motility associated factor glycosyltransferase family protein [Spirochaetales bacterium]